MSRGARSKLESIALLPDSERAAFLASLTDAEVLALSWDWAMIGRPEQQPPPGDWATWLVMVGRGWGKTTTGAHWVRTQMETGTCRRIALVNDTAADVRDVMIEGPAGLLAVSPPWNKPTYQISNRRVVWPNGAMAIAYAAEAPELLRGPEHDGAWCDELAKWRNLRKVDPHGGTAFDNLRFGLRGGEKPRLVVTTTPRPVPTLKALMRERETIITKGALDDNAVNLAPAFLETIRRRYEGTRLGRQELGGELLDDIEGALWQLARIDELRVSEEPMLVRIVVAIDPSVSSGDESAETGIVVAGVSESGEGYVLEDDSMRGTPAQWGLRAIDAYRRWRADRIIGEGNNGGEMIEHVIRSIDRSVSYSMVTASRGKITRAEPVSALYEQGRVHHVGTFAQLEDQMTSWLPGIGMASPDRMDALVWALSELMLGAQANARALEVW